MNTKRCAFVAAVILTVCTVAFLCGKTTGDATEASVTVTSSVPVVSAAHSAAVQAVASCVAPPASNQTATVRGTKPYVLTCEGSFKKPLRLAAESLGAKPVGVLARNSLLIEADAPTLERLRADKRFTVEREYLPSDKIAPALAEMIAGGAGEVEVSVVTLSADDHQRVQDRVLSCGGEILTGCFNEGSSFRARIPAALVSELASFGDVRWMETFVRPHVMNDFAISNAAMNVQAAWDVLGLSGAGQIISTSDSGIDLTHLDLTNRVPVHKVVEGCVDHDGIGHGTHTAGSIVGDGTRSGGQIRGTAYGADLYAWFCGVDDGLGIYTPETIAELFRGNEDGTEWDAYIHSASWGSDVEGAYDVQCADIDKYIWEHPDFLPVFAAGNAGSAGEQTIGSPAAAKNVLAVGATQNLRAHYPKDDHPTGDPTRTALFSSRGPCQDGRIKPDVAAPGVGILSTRAYNQEYARGVSADGNYAYECGTSMACPLTAGTVALVRQWLMEQQEGFEDEDGKRPTAALMKAVVMGGAKDASWPNNDQGWGRVDLMETVAPSDRAVKLVDRIPFADGASFTYVVQTTNEAPLDVQLVWIDYPSSSGGSSSAPKLVNDLDLTVEAVDTGDGKMLYGNGGREADKLNNAESVRVAAAAADTYFITVDCPSILHDCTEGGAAALYIRGAFDPDMPPRDVERVRIRETGETFFALDKALQAVEDGQTVEVLRPCKLRASATVSADCTIVATNANPAAATVTVLSDRALGIDAGARVLFTNVVFRGEQEAPVVLTVAASGTAAVAGRVGLDEIRTEDAAGLELAGALDTFIAVRCAEADERGEKFGTYSCAADVATACAAHLKNASDGELGGTVAEEGNALVWDRLPIEPEFAKASVETPGGKTEYYIHLNKIFDEHADGTVYILKDCELEAGAAVRGDMKLTCTNIAPAVVSYAPNAAVILSNRCSLVLSNVTVTGADGGAFIVKSGTLTMRPDASIIKCSARKGNTYGGAIRLCGAESVLNLEGGKISNCSALMYGGGVCADSGSKINFSGPLTIFGNSSVNSKTDDIYISNPGTVTLTLKDNLIGGSVGLFYAFGAPDEGEPFMVNGIGTSADAFTLSRFVNEDLNAEKKMEAALSEDASHLVWVAADTSADTKRTEAHVAQIVRENGSVTNYFKFIDGPDGAFAAIDEDGLKVELLLNSSDILIFDSIPVNRKVTLCLADEVTSQEDVVVTCRSDCGFEVLPGGELTVDGVRIQSNGLISGAPLLHARGGALVLTHGAVVTGVRTAANRGAGAVDVSANGVFTMEDGAEISSCFNYYVNEGDQTGVGAGLLVDKGVAYLRGGLITNNLAFRAAGVFVGNEGVLYVSGDMTVTGNRTISGEKSDIVVEDLGRLYLEGAIAGGAKMGVGEGIVSESTDLNVFGRVVDELRPSIWDYAESAERFFRDKKTTDRGQIATNATEALLIWASAMPNGVYTNAAGEVYGRVGDAPPVPPPQQWEVVTNHPGPIAFKSIDRVSDTEWTLVVTDRVEYCNYRLIWTDNLEKGFTSTGDWEHAVGPAALPEWTTNVITSGSALFWRAEGADGTNMVLKTEE